MDKIFGNVLKRRGNAGNRWKIQPSLEEKASIINSLTRASMSQCWSTINRGTDLLAFHSNLLSSIFAPLTREILNFLKMERDLGIRVLWRVGRYATRSYCIINSNLLTSFQPWISERIHSYISSPYHLYFPTKFIFFHQLFFISFR